MRIKCRFRTSVDPGRHDGCDVFNTFRSSRRLYHESRVPGGEVRLAAMGGREPPESIAVLTVVLVFDSTTEGITIQYNVLFAVPKHD